MTPELAELVRAVGAAGLTLQAEGAAIRTRGARGALTPELRSAITRHRDELRAHLLATPGASRPAHGDAGDGPVPLTPAQLRIWLGAVRHGGTSLYNEPLIVRLTGPLDVTALGTAIGAVVERHEPLRSTIVLVDGIPHQVVRPRATVELPLHDLCGLDVEARAAAAAALVASAVGDPFALEEEIPFRAVLVRHERRCHDLVLVRHHLAGDGWSVPILLRDLAEAYLAPDGTAGSLRPLPVRFRDVASWMSSVAAAGGFDEATAHWQQVGEHAAGLGRRATAGSALGAGPVRRQRHVVDPFTVDALRAVARHQAATLSSVVAAGVAHALVRLLGRTEVVVGVAVSNRTSPVVDDLVGALADVVPLVLELDAVEPFDELVGRVGRLTQRALELQPAGPGPASILPVDAVLAFQNLPVVPIDLPGLEAELRETPPGPPKAPVLATANLRPDGALEVVLDTDDATWSVAAARALATCVARSVEGAAADPTQPCRALAATAERERPADPPAPLAEPLVPVPRTLARRAAAAPDRIAVVAGDHQVTYGALVRAAVAEARVLRRDGVGPESQVPVVLPLGIELVVRTLSVMLAGAAYVPIDPADGSARAARMRRRPAGPDVPSTVPLALDNLAYVVHTSGSTGAPKGVMVSHRSLADLVAGTVAAVGGAPEDVWSAVHRPAFDFSVWEIWGCLATGGRLVLVPDDVVRSPEALWDLLQEQRVTVLSQTPTAFAGLVAVATSTGGRPPRVVVLGGERCDPAALAPWVVGFGPGSRIVNMYGITETTVHVTAHEIGEHDLGAAASPIGTCLPGREARVIDAFGSEAVVGMQGELAVAGPCVARGYAGRPDLTAERFRPAPTRPGAREYRSGDRVAVVGAGLTYLGRLDDQVSLRGLRIEPGEVRAALLADPAVADAVVGAVEPDGRLQLAAWLVPVPGEPLAAIEVRRRLGPRLPEHMIPTAWAVVDVLPRTPNGKVDRSALPAPSGAGAQGRPPRSPIEVAVARLWSEVLGADVAAADLTFYELGGDSLQLAQVGALLPSAVGVELPLHEVFAAPTVAGIATAVEDLAVVGADLEAALDEIEALTDDEVRRWLM